MSAPETAARAEWLADYGSLDGFENDCFRTCDGCRERIFVGEMGEIDAGCEIRTPSGGQEWVCHACQDDSEYHESRCFVGNNPARAW